LIFFAVFGGVNVFGFLGLFIGPVILALTVTTLAMLREESRAWKPTSPEEPTVGEVLEPHAQAHDKTR
jgi:predicted PurR-regulated permease PerM